MSKLVPVLLVAAIALCGCATRPQAVFYLVPDPEGNVGEVTVTNASGEVVLSQANESVAAPGADKAFRDSRLLDDASIEKRFGETLSALPERPKGFEIYFGSGESALSPEAHAVLAEVLKEVGARDSHDISLNGHTDRVGDAASNMYLSVQRATSVEDWLVENGVPAAFLTIEYYGESKPLVPTADDVAEPKNRRVEVVVR